FPLSLSRPSICDSCRMVVRKSGSSFSSPALKAPSVSTWAKLGARSAARAGSTPNSASTRCQSSTVEGMSMVTVLLCNDRAGGTPEQVLALLGLPEQGILEPPRAEGEDEVDDDAQAYRCSMDAN